MNFLPFNDSIIVAKKAKLFNEFFHLVWLGVCPLVQRTWNQSKFHITLWIKTKINYLSCAQTFRVFLQYFNVISARAPYDNSRSESKQKYLKALKNPFFAQNVDGQTPKWFNWKMCTFVPCKRWILKEFQIFCRLNCSDSLAVNLGTFLSPDFFGSSFYSWALLVSKCN